MERVQFILGCIPVDCDRNRAHATALGCGNIPLPPPYRDSVQDSCRRCRGPVWVGPEIKAKRAKLIRAGDDPLIMCLLCAALYQTLTDADMEIYKLSDKDSERGQ